MLNTCIDNNEIIDKLNNYNFGNMRSLFYQYLERTKEIRLRSRCSKIEWTLRPDVAATVVGKMNNAILLFPRDDLHCIFMDVYNGVELF